MRPFRRPRRRHERGFTLLELGIVLGVTAILAAAIAPDMIESMRNRMAGKAAHDVAMIHDAARLFWIESGRDDGTFGWPGVPEGVVGCPAGVFDLEDARGDLLMGGFIGGGDLTNPTLIDPATFMMNPWGRAYDLTVWEPAMAVAGAPRGCLFGVATTLPEPISNAFISLLPQSACNRAGVTPCPPDPNGVPTGFARCCSYVPPPGGEMFAECPRGWFELDPGGFFRCAP